MSHSFEASRFEKVRRKSDTNKAWMTIGAAAREDDSLFLPGQFPRWSQGSMRCIRKGYGPRSRFGLDVLGAWSSCGDSAFTLEGWDALSASVTLSFPAAERAI